ncbi:hypothetical protein Fmac_000762 [Flemingia macrophylla]|uniref:Uncharacterized protein n=1 Tax=Flemingia macrophylla TaxID=520843 RepID=A0ABD1NF58_9FABA
MTMRTTCFLNPPPPTSLIPAKPPQHVIPSETKNEGCWRKQCTAMGVACTLIGLEMCNSVTLPHQTVQITTMPKTNEISNNSYYGGGTKWSETRTCPSWRHSSLETIVPENLPRPSARRRYEAVGSTSKTAPPLSAPAAKLESKRGSCFSM